MMGKRIIFIVVIWMALATLALGANKRFTLVIDAGHGGRDAGCVGAISKEKNLTLKMALAFGKYVERNCPDVKVIYTRKTDVFLELWQRAEIANKNKADLFLSIHINALPGKKIGHGVQTYTLGRGRVSGSNKGISENLDVAKRENAVIVMEKDYQQHYAGFDPNSPESSIMFEFIQDTYREYGPAERRRPSGQSGGAPPDIDAGMPVGVGLHLYARRGAVYELSRGP